MALSQAPGQKDIINRLKTIPGVSVHVGEYIQDSFAPNETKEGLFQPYVTVKFAGSFPTNDSGIVSPRLDTMRATFNVFTVAPDDMTSLELMDLVRDKLVGYTPTDGGQIREYSGYSFVDADLGYHRYVHNAGFHYTHNLNS